VSKLRAAARAEAAAEHEAAEAARAARQGGSAAVLSARQEAAATAARLAAEAEAEASAAAAAATAALAAQASVSEAEARASVASAIAQAQHAAENCGRAAPDTVDVGPVSVPVLAVSSRLVSESADAFSATDVAARRRSTAADVIDARDRIDATAGSVLPPPVLPDVYGAPVPSPSPETDGGAHLYSI
jgi:hypothetical protein